MALARADLASRGRRRHGGRGRAAILLTASCQVFHAQAWWDEGHMLTGLVAKLHVLDPARFDRVLSCQDGSDPGNDNFTDIVTSSAWMDHAKCNTADADRAWCQGLAEKPGARVFFASHLAKTTYDPKNVGKQLSLKGQLSLVPDWNDRDFPNGVTAINDASETIRGKAQSSWSLALNLRHVLHVWGDLHQPLHTCDLYDNDTFKRGDLGGNAVLVSGLAVRAGAGNLHAMWDSVGGAMPGSFPVSSLEETADQLMRDYPASYFIQTNRLNANWNNPSANFGISNVADFTVKFVQDTNKLVADVVYKEYLEIAWPDKNYVPTDAYNRQVVAKGREQVALGGYRLASWLNYHAEFMPESPCEEVGGLGFRGTMILSVVFGLLLGGGAGCVCFTKLIVM